IPLEELRGVEEHFTALRAPHPEIDFIALLSSEGRILHASSGKSVDEVSRRIANAVRGESREEHPGFFFHKPPSSVKLLPVEAPSGAAASIAVGTDEHFAERQLRQLTFDVIVILIVAVFLSFEISIAVMN